MPKRNRLVHCVDLGDPRPVAATAAGRWAVSGLLTRRTGKQSSQQVSDNHWGTLHFQGGQQASGSSQQHTQLQENPAPPALCQAQQSFKHNSSMPAPPRPEAERGECLGNALCWAFQTFLKKLPKSLAGRFVVSLRWALLSCPRRSSGGSWMDRAPRGHRTGGSLPPGASLLQQLAANSILSPPHATLRAQSKHN